MIDAYDFGRIVIDGTAFKNDVIIFPDRVEADWWRKDGHVLHIEDIESIVTEEPEVLIVGTGKYGVMTVPPQTREHIKSNGIELISEPTDQACKVYNEVSKAKAKKVVAALHLTC